MHLRSLELTVLSDDCLGCVGGVQLLGGAIQKGGVTSGVIKSVL